ncbi:MAG: glycosyltransferase [Planctomycetes bacterium]|nr:glycosyltransferase [Planctomycetota bacterium]
MSWQSLLMSIAFACSVLPALLGAINLRRYRVIDAGSAADGERPTVTVCVPARNEENNIEACVRSALASTGVDVEVLVHDDASTDATPAILAALCEEDARVRVVEREPLPPGWNGKQWGCQRMGLVAAGDWLLFTDADVRLAPSALRSAWLAARSGGSALVSTVPRQETGSWMEDAVIPLIHFVLLCYLPFGQMRSTLRPAASAGCGQFLFVDRRAWRAAGGHGTFRESMHDGIKLPRAVRRAGLRTDLFDGTPVVSCRMYHGAAAVWRGFAKNAFEGLGSFGLLLFVTVVHALGHVLPAAWIAWALVQTLIDRRAWGTPEWLALAAVVASIMLRLAFMLRFRQSMRSVLLHPIGIAVLTIIQWHSAWLHITGRRSWKGRSSGGATLPAAG